MMVGYDHGHAQALRQPDFLVVGDAEVNRDKHPVCLRKLSNGFDVKAVAFLTQGNMRGCVHAEAPKRQREQRARADAVHIVIAVYHRGQALIPGTRKNGGSLRHAAHKHRIMKLFKRRMQKTFCLRRVGDAARMKQPRRYARIRAKRGCGAAVKGIRAAWDETEQWMGLLSLFSPRDTPARYSRSRCFACF